MISVIAIWIFVMIISTQITKKYSTAMCYNLGCLDAHLGCYGVNLSYFDARLGCLGVNIGCLDAHLSFLDAHLGCLVREEKLERNW